MASERTSHLTKPVGEKEKKKERKKRKRKRELIERSSTFSLNFPVIEPAVSGRAKGKVHPHGKSFAPRPESKSFDKLQEVGVFLLLGLVFG